jgi:hypothetical protein
MGTGWPIGEGWEKLSSSILAECDRSYPMEGAMNKDNKIEKELRQIRNLLILLAMKSGASSDEVHYTTGMGAANIRRMFPIKRGKRSSATKK